VWNLSVKQEQQMEVNDWSILQLRHMALKILLLKDGTVNTVIEKLVLVLARLVSVISLSIGFNKISVSYQLINCL
jgi:hypothetical protein